MARARAQSTGSFKTETLSPENKGFSGCSGRMWVFADTFCIAFRFRIITNYGIWERRPFI